MPAAHYRPLREHPTMLEVVEHRWPLRGAVFTIQLPESDHICEGPECPCLLPAAQTCVFAPAPAHYCADPLGCGDCERLK